MSELCSKGGREEPVAWQGALRDSLGQSIEGGVQGSEDEQVGAT